MTSIFSKALLLVIPIAVVLGAPDEARAQIVVSVAPPAAYIATSTPEYFEGRPVYYYNNSWYYRDHGRWGYYRNEPGYLRDRRAHWAPAPRGGYRGGNWGGRYHYRR
jgi:hypothetical protein